jgi:hypothetical protein
MSPQILAAADERLVAEAIHRLASIPDAAGRRRYLDSIHK